MLSRGPIYICIIKGPHFPHRDIKGTQISKIHHEMCTEYLKSYDRDKRVQSLGRGVCGGGVEGIRLWSMGRSPGKSIVHGPRTSLLRHCFITLLQSMHSNSEFFFSFSFSFLFFHCKCRHFTYFVFLEIWNNCIWRFESDFSFFWL